MVHLSYRVLRKAAPYVENGVVVEITDKAEIRLL